MEDFKDIKTRNRLKNIFYYIMNSSEDERKKAYDNFKKANEEVRLTNAEWLEARSENREDYRD